jgi:prephenate dehydratase
MLSKLFTQPLTKGLLLPSTQSLKLRSFSSQDNAAEAHPHWEIKDKTGIQFTVTDKPGILKNILKVFTTNNIDLTYINSKPAPFSDRKKEAVFFVDFNGALEDQST